MAFNRTTSRLSFRTHQSNLSSLRRQKSRGPIAPSPAMTPDHPGMEQVGSVELPNIDVTDLIGNQFAQDPEGETAFGHIGSGELEIGDSLGPAHMANAGRQDTMTMKEDGGIPVAQTTRRSETLLFRTQSSLKRAGSKVKSSLSEFGEVMRQSDQSHLGLGLMMGLPTANGF